ncbi:NAD-dependent epimerase/dehydratase family protein [Xanthomonas sp. AM6]|uniref:NAD-dependent epimerase/dehydratase family protein n=1 Tax=Xanthomonas sp. AM6 TaxID=2982531 RepID=UPI0021D8BEAC|nr:NAD-dependent epimerase/dehydratase family protein [Xanthomonas sp. AM6]UYB51858.1 NAD-dependent epimerase/dehydratase family protein [Xanthomonas sp. AM6]
MARILVTGASGFIGAHIVRALAAQGAQVRASGRNAAALAAFAGDPRIDVVRAELCRDDLASLLHGCEAVIHCAALSAPWASAEVFRQANVVATERMLAAAQRAQVRRFVHFSSPSIYFRFADQYQVTEDFTPPPRWIGGYPQTKWEAEEKVRAAAAAGLPALVLRPRAVFGHGDNAIVPRLLAVAQRGWFPLVHGGRAMIDVCCVENAVAAALAALRAEQFGDGRAYNISNGAPIAVRDLLTELFAALRLRVRLLPVPRRLALALATVGEQIALRRRGQPEPRLSRYGIGVLGYSQTLDIGRARRELGYAPVLSTEAGIAALARG